MSDAEAERGLKPEQGFDLELELLDQGLEAAEANDADAGAEALEEGFGRDQDGRAGATKASGGGMRMPSAFVPPSRLRSRALSINFS